MYSTVAIPAGDGGEGEGREGTGSVCAARTVAPAVDVHAGAHRHLFVLAPGRLRRARRRLRALPRRPQLLLCRAQLRAPAGRSAPDKMNWFRAFALGYPIAIYIKPLVHVLNLVY